MTHRYTLLSRFFGLHRVHLPGTTLGKKVYFVVMGNVFPIDKDIHERSGSRLKLSSYPFHQSCPLALKCLAAWSQKWHHTDTTI